MAAFRMTQPTRAILDAVQAAKDDQPVWGRLICDETGLASGTVYPILGRLEKAGWVTVEDEATRPVGRPPRRYYTMTAAGRRGYAEALAARTVRRAREAVDGPSAPDQMHLVVDRSGTLSVYVGGKDAREEARTTARVFQGVMTSLPISDDYRAR